MKAVTPGFKLDKGFTRHFLAAMVVFRDFKQAELLFG